MRAIEKKLRSIREQRDGLQVEPNIKACIYTCLGWYSFCCIVCTYLSCTYSLRPKNSSSPSSPSLPSSPFSPSSLFPPLLPPPGGVAIAPLPPRLRPRLSQGPAVSVDSPPRRGPAHLRYDRAEDGGSQTTQQRGGCPFLCTFCVYAANTSNANV